jgi:hypothetical protein
VRVLAHSPEARPRLLLADEGQDLVDKPEYGIHIGAKVHLGGKHQVAGRRPLCSKRLDGCGVEFHVHAVGDDDGEQAWVKVEQGVCVALRDRDNAVGRATGAELVAPQALPLDKGVRSCNPARWLADIGPERPVLHHILGIVIVEYEEGARRWVTSLSHLKKILSQLDTFDLHHVGIHCEEGRAESFPEFSRSQPLGHVRQPGERQTSETLQHRALWGRYYPHAVAQAVQWRAAAPVRVAKGQQMDVMTACQAGDEVVVAHGCALMGGVRKLGCQDQYAPARDSIRLQRRGLRICSGVGFGCRRGSVAHKLGW